MRETDYRLLKLLESKPHLRQRDLAREMGVSLGKVNYCLGALVAKGWVKARNFRNSHDKLGYAYYSDEQVGVRKYQADPDAPEANKELALISTAGYLEDNEGISIYEVSDGTGYILVSDQSANKFHIYKREGEPGNPHEHKEVKVVDVSTTNSDGSDVTNAPLGPKFPAGLFVAMADNKTFQFYSWQQIAGGDLVLAPNGIKK